MGLVVDRQDIFQAHEIGHDALQHLALSFEGVELFSKAALQQLPASFGEVDALSQFEGVKVGDDDLGFVHIVEHIVRNQLAVGVVAVGVVGLQNAQAVFDRDAWRDDQKAARKVLAVRSPYGIDGLPGDQHGHHRRFPGAGGQLERNPGEVGVGVFVGPDEVVEQTLTGGSFGGHFSEPDGGLSRFDLAEERPDA